MCPGGEVMAAGVRGQEPQIDGKHWEKSSLS